MNLKFNDDKKTNYELADLKTYMRMALGKTVEEPPSGDLFSLLQQQALEIEELKELVLGLRSAIKEQTTNEWITSREVMEMLRISKRTLQNYRNARVLEFTKLRGKCFYRIGDVHALLTGPAKGSPG